MARPSANLASTRNTGTLSIPRSRDRSYFMLKLDTGVTATLAFGGGDPMPMDAGDIYEPSVVPTGVIDIVASGLFTVVMG